MQRLRHRGAGLARARAVQVRLASRCAFILALRGLGLVVAVLFAALPALAESGHVPSSARPIFLRDAIERTLADNKHLVADAHREGEQRGRIEQVGLLPNPVLGLVLEDLGGSGTYNGVDRAETTLTLGWLIEPMARRRRTAAAEAGLDLVMSASEIHRLDAAAETAQWFLTALAEQARLENAGRAVELTQDTVSTIEKRVRAGRSAKAELARAEAELAMAELAHDDVTHDLDVAYHRLAGQWGQVEPDFTRVMGDLLETPAVVSYDELEGRLDRNPQLVQLAAEIRLAEASLAEARTGRWMSVRPSIGMRHYAATDDYSVFAGFSMPVPVFSRSQGRVRETKSSVARSRADLDASRVTVRSALFEAHIELEHYLHRARALREKVIPRLEDALVETRVGFERGRYGYLEWRTLQLELLEARSQVVEASVSAHRLVVALERLTGGEVVAR